MAHKFAHLQFGGFLGGRRGVVTQHLERDTLLGHGDDSFLVP